MHANLNWLRQITNQCLCEWLTFLEVFVRVHAQMKYRTCRETKIAASIHLDLIRALFFANKTPSDTKRAEHPFWRAI